MWPPYRRPTRRLFLFYILLTVHHVMILAKWPTWCTILFYVFIFIFNSLHVSSTSCSSSGEANCVNTASGNSHSMLVAMSCAGWEFTPNLTQFVSPDDEHDLLETCRELKININTNKWICASCWSFTKSLFLLFQTHYSIPGLRFRAPRNVFAKSEENPENACYCHPDREFCPPSGLFKVSPCVYGKAGSVKRSVETKPHYLIKPSFRLKSHYVPTLGYVGLKE